MQKIVLIGADPVRGLIALIMIVNLASFSAAAQENGNVSGALTPKDLMLRAANQNGLMGEEMSPWHLKASFTEFAEDGSVNEVGTFEEFWVSQTEFKCIFTGKGFTETEYGTAKGNFRADVRGDVPPLLEQARLEFSSPLPSSDLVGKGSFEVREIETGGIKLECLRSTGMAVSPDRTYCLGAEKPFLRITSWEEQQKQILHNRILGFRGRFIAGDIQFVVAGKRKLTAHLENIEPLTPVDDGMFTPPSDAISIPKTGPIDLVNISVGAATGMLLRKVAPQYPPFALRERITGTVVLEATIGKDGRIEDLKVVSGPSELRTASLEAVHQWRYRPYLLNGEPVAVRTTINVFFALSH